MVFIIKLFYCLHQDYLCYIASNLENFKLHFLWSNMFVDKANYISRLSFLNVCAGDTHKVLPVPKQKNS